MAATNQLETFTAGEETAVDIAGIERQLAALWGAATEADHAVGGPAITRACVNNLVAYTETETEREHATDTIRTLTSRHPCRALVLHAEPDLPGDGLSASITAHCHLAEGGGKQVCCEQISLHARGAGVRQLPGAVLPLLESDLPTILWWQGNFLRRPELFARLSAAADRIFFDTSLWELDVRHRADLPRLVQALAEHQDCSFCDLSWTRLGFWRQLTADLFEAGECRAELARLDSVRIVHGRGPGAEWRAMLFGGWLAAQLEWPAETARARLQLEQSESEDTAGVGLVKVELRNSGASFTVYKRHGEQAAITVVHMPHVCELPWKRAFWPTDDPALLSEELDRPTRRLVYDRTLRKTAEVWA